MTGLLGVAENHLSKVGAPVVDVGAVAFHDRPDDRQHRIKRAWGGLGIRPAPLERFGVGGVLHKQEELALGLCIEEQRPGAYVGLVGYLLGRDLIDAVQGEQLAGGSADAVELVLFVPLAPSDRLRGERHDGVLRQ